jgi:hypothetical protein
MNEMFAGKTVTKIGVPQKAENFNMLAEQLLSFL